MGWLPLWLSLPIIQTIKKARFDITDITKQDIRKLLNKFDNFPYLVYKIKQVYNEPTEY